jgi:2-polyprenyl-6-methoxyphenol hydroxylase-like FAD-dependent oxidoreductase
MGFLLMENGLSALTRLGLGDRARRQGVVATRSTIMRPDGSVILERSFAPHLGMARRSLINLLLEALPDHAVHYGRAIDPFDLSEGVLRFPNGSALPADLYVGADGQWSAVRNFVAPGHCARPGHVAELISAVEAPDIVKRLGSTLLRVRHPDGGLGAGIVPTSAQTVVWYVTHDTRKWVIDDDPAGRQGLAGTVHHWPWPFPELLQRTDFARSYVWRTADMEPLPALFRGNVALIGDAAHPLVPFSTQGVNSALVDAVTLADALSTGGPDSAPALQAWSRERTRVVSTYLEYGRARASTFLDPVHSPDDPPFPEAAGRLDLELLNRSRETT